MVGKGIPYRGESGDADSDFESAPVHNNFSFAR